MRYLADTSIWSWANNQPGSKLAARFSERIERDEIVTSPVIALEVLRRPRTGAEYELMRDLLYGGLRWLWLTERTGERALVVQRELAGAGNGRHRRPAADFLIAATAEQAGSDVTLWFFDKDLRVICEHTGQSFEAEMAA